MNHESFSYYSQTETASDHQMLQSCPHERIGGEQSTREKRRLEALRKRNIQERVAKRNKRNK